MEASEDNIKNRSAYLKKKTTYRIAQNAQEVDLEAKTQQTQSQPLSSEPKWTFKSLFTKKKSSFIAAITIQSIILALEQCVLVNQYFQENPQSEQLIHYVKILSQYALFILLVSFLIIFLQTDSQWQTTNLTSTLKFYFIQGMLYLNYPLTTSGLNVQSMGCFAMTLLMLQVSHLLIFPVPLVHQLAASYLFACHLFYRFHYFVLNATTFQQQGQMSAAEQLFNVGMLISLLTVAIIFKDQNQVVHTHVEEQVKDVLQLDEQQAKPQQQNNNVIKVAEIEMTFSSERSLLGDLDPKYDKSHLREASTQTVIEGTAQLMGHKSFFDMNQISAIGLNPDNHLSDYLELGSMRHDISKNISDQPLVKKIFFQKVVEIIHTPIFVLDASVLDNILEASRQLKNSQLIDLNSETQLNELLLYKNPSFDQVVQWAGTDLSSFISQPLFEVAVVNGNKFDKPQTQNKDQQKSVFYRKNQSGISVLDLVAILYDRQLAKSEWLTLFLSLQLTNGSLEIKQNQAQFNKQTLFELKISVQTVGDKQYLVVTFVKLDQQKNFFKHRFKNSQSMKFQNWMGGDTLVKLQSISSLSALIEQKLSHLLGEASATKLNAKISKPKAATGVNNTGILFSILKSLAINVWQNAITLQHEILSRDAYLNLLTQTQFKQKFKKHQFSIQQAVEIFMLPFKKQLDTQKIELKLEVCNSPAGFVCCDWSAYFAILYQVFSIVTKNSLTPATITIRIQLDALSRGDQGFIKTQIFENFDKDIDPEMQNLNSGTQKSFLIARCLVQALGGTFSTLEEYKLKRDIRFSIFVYKNETLREVNAYAQQSFAPVNMAEIGSSKNGLSIDPSLFSQIVQSLQSSLKNYNIEQMSQLFPIKEKNKSNLNISAENKKLLSKANFLEDDVRGQHMLFPSVESSKDDNLSQRSQRSYQSSANQVPSEPEIAEQLKSQHDQEDQHQKSAENQSKISISMHKGKANFSSASKFEFINQENTPLPVSGVAKSLVKFNSGSQEINFDHECNCSQILIVGGEDLANFPVRQVLKSLFNIKYVDQAADSDQAIQFFTSRISRKCCTKHYKLVICEVDLEGVAQMSKTIRLLTKIRIQQHTPHADHSDLSLSGIENNGSKSFSHLDMSQLMSKIQTKTKDCALIGLGDNKVENEQLKSIIHSTKKPKITKQAYQLGFSEVVAKPLSIEQLTYLLEKYLQQFDENST